MDTLSKLIICVILGAFYIPTATAYEFHDPYPNVKVIDGDVHIQRPGGGTTLAYPNAGISKEIPVNTSKGGYLVPVEKTFPVVPAKVGKAATRFLKTLPVIGTAISLYDTVCDLTDICIDLEDSGRLMYRTYAGYIIASSMSCDVPFMVEHIVVYPASYVRFMKAEVSSPLYGYTHNSPCTGQPGYRVLYTTVYSTILPPNGSQYRELTESDWTSAESKLNAHPQQTAEALYNSDAPVPVDASTQSAPVTQQIAQTSTQTKDALGNVTGTQVETKIVKVEDTSTTNNVTYNITETTTVTHYDENNEITGTETSTSDNSPPKSSTDETTVSFDDVPPDELETEEPEFDLDEPVSWGDGTCPADVELGIYNLSISYAPACDAAEMLRPIFILLASITAMFIVAGVSRKD